MHADGITLAVFLLQEKRLKQVIHTCVLLGWSLDQCVLILRSFCHGRFLLWPLLQDVTLLEESVRPRTNLPPLLLKLRKRPAETLDYLGVSYGLAGQLFRYSTTPNLTRSPYPSLEPFTLPPPHPRAHTNWCVLNITGEIVAASDFNFVHSSFFHFLCFFSVHPFSCFDTFFRPFFLLLFLSDLTFFLPTCAPPPFSPFSHPPRPPPRHPASPSNWKYELLISMSSLTHIYFVFLFVGVCFSGSGKKADLSLSICDKHQYVEEWFCLHESRQTPTLANFLD